MNYKNLKASLKAKNALYEHYKEMYEVALIELKFDKLQNDCWLGVISEVENLLSQKVSHNLIKKVIGNGKERQILDKLIHTDLLFKN